MQLGAADPEYAPPAHAEHVPTPAPDAEPAAQDVQLSEPATATLPASHVEHDTVPDDPAKVPAAHCVHATAAAPDANVPVEHGVHSAAPEAEYMPAAQFVQNPDVAVE